jgi:midasin (ATPase involved in ribosome maturation)
MNCPRGSSDPHYFPYTMKVNETTQGQMPRMSNLNSNELISFLSENYGNEFGGDAVNAACREFNVSYPTITKRLDQYKTGHGRWNLTAQELQRVYDAPAATDREETALIPVKDDTFVPFGNFSDVKKIIQSGIFYPTFITGLSGNGKTFSVEQACAALNRELVRVNITIETDEDDLIGGFRLVNGETVWHNGPVIEAMERGAVLLLDEIDLASNKILCLQSILEGKGVFLKKIGKYVCPASGFNVFATANTKGKGSDDGRFIGTNVLNEAFLERFPVTFEQEYPSASTEKKILEGISLDLGIQDRQFCQRLTDWAQMIRKTFYEGAIDEIISTRRLTHIIRAYSIFNDKAKAIKVCLNRFDDETKQSFMDLYDKVDVDVEFSEPAID